MSADEQLQKRTRRSFLLLLPLGVVAGIFTSVGVAALRFLRPRIVRESSDNWIDIAPVSDLTGRIPLGKKISMGHVTGWAVTQEEHQVYVLPGNQVVSAV